MTPADLTRLRALVHKAQSEPWPIAAVLARNRLSVAMERQGEELLALAERGMLRDLGLEDKGRRRQAALERYNARRRERKVVAREYLKKVERQFVDACHELKQSISGAHNESATPVASCMDCGEPYSSRRFPDLVIDNAAWKLIAPDDGLLCPGCINARLERIGLTEVAVKFRSGPMAIYDAAARAASLSELARLDAGLLDAAE